MSVAVQFGTKETSKQIKQHTKKPKNQTNKAGSKQTTQRLHRKKRKKHKRIFSAKQCVTQIRVNTVNAPVPKLQPRPKPTFLLRSPFRPLLPTRLRSWARGPSSQASLLQTCSRRRCYPEFCSGKAAVDAGRLAPDPFRRRYSVGVRSRNSWSIDASKPAPDQFLSTLLTNVSLRKILHQRHPSCSSLFSVNATPGGVCSGSSWSDDTSTRAPDPLPATLLPRVLLTKEVVVLLLVGVLLWLLLFRACCCPTSCACCCACSHSSCACTEARLLLGRRFLFGYVRSIRGRLLVGHIQTREEHAPQPQRAPLFSLSASLRGGTGGSPWI